jgi:hypothetical protein
VFPITVNVKADVHVHVHSGEAHPAAMDLLKILVRQGDSLMADVATINQKLTNIKTSAEAIAADIARIKGQIVGGITAEQADAIQAELTALEARFAQIDADTPETT